MEVLNYYEYNDRQPAPMRKEVITLEEFLALPIENVARLVRQSGPQVCVFPINGTRRWYALEHGDNAASLNEYINISAHTYITLFRLLYEHGIDTILSPLFGNDLLKRGNDYVAATLSQGMPILESPDFMDFYRDCDIRVRFYGDYCNLLAGSTYANIIGFFDHLTTQTGNHKDHRLLFGVFADDATRQIGELAVEYYQAHSCCPDRDALVTAYYGEYIERVSFFIGFDRFAVFDYPLLATGEEDLYFTVAPSPYLNERAFRTILYDHLYTRRVTDPDWSDLSQDARSELRLYYRANRENILGAGRLVNGVWMPIVAS